MHALNGRVNIAPTDSSRRNFIGVSSHCHTPAALYRRETIPNTHWIGGWVGLRAGVGTEAGGKIFASADYRTLGRPVCSRTLYNELSQLMTYVSWYYCFCGAILPSIGITCSAWQWVVLFQLGSGKCQTVALSFVSERAVPKCMEQRSWEDIIYLSEITRLLLNHNVRGHIHNSPILVSVLIHMNPVLAFISYFYPF
jgi:hypothetical protein